MSCRDFEKLIALHVEGDLENALRSRVEAHLRVCSSCWDVAEDLKESQSVLKAIRQDVPDRAMLSNVHARILNDVAQIEPGTWFERILIGGFRQKATLAGVILMIVAGGTLWFSQRLQFSVEPPPEIVWSTPPPAAVASSPPPEPVAPPPARKARVRPRQPAVASAEPHETLTVKLLTDDPNIIVYWVIDDKGD
jgi:hypothetical protein